VPRKSKSFLSLVKLQRNRTLRSNIIILQGEVIIGEFIAIHRKDQIVDIEVAGGHLVQQHTLQSFHLDRLVYLEGHQLTVAPMAIILHIHDQVHHAAVLFLVIQVALAVICREVTVGARSRASLRSFGSPCRSLT